MYARINNPNKFNTNDTKKINDKFNQDKILKDLSEEKDKLKLDQMKLEEDYEKFNSKLKDFSKKEDELNKKYHELNKKELKLSNIEKDLKDSIYSYQVSLRLIDLSTKYVSLLSNNKEALKVSELIFEDIK